MLCTAINRKGTKCQNKAIDSSGFCRYHHHTPLRPSNGKAFEEEVFKILRVLGYTVRCNEQINGCQIDIYGEFQTGVISLRLMVECKDYSKPIGIKHINKFAGVLSVARNNGAVDKGLFVTTHGYTAQAKEYARIAGIELTTYDELSTQLANFDHYIDQIISDFDNSPVSRFYVDLTGTEVEDYEGNEDATLYRPVDTFIHHYLFEDNQGKLALLGNFGTGKSTFCQKYAYKLAKKYRENKTTRIPIIISLKDYDSKFHIQHLILNTLQIQYGINITLPVIHALQRIGKFFFLFDGFDEMDAKANPDTIRENLRELNKITEIKENKFIVTCRTHFFRNKLQAEVLADFKILYIPEWGEVELKEYLQKRFGDQWKTYINRISGTHNLPELAKTPLFLEMIAETLPKLGDVVKRIELYRVYTDNWIKSQSKRKGALLTANERRIFIKEFAIKLYNEDRISCHYKDFFDILHHYLSQVQSQDDKRFEIDNAVQMDYLRNDVQTCTFLIRDSAGNYSFRHKSFMEFFVAQKLSDEISNGSCKCLEGNQLPVEIRGFLIDFLKDAPPANNLIDWFKNTNEAILRDNLLALILGLKINISNSITEIENKTGSELNVFVRFRQGDTSAFDMLYKRYYNTLYKTAYKYTKRSEVAKDIVIEAFLNLWQKREYLDNINQIKSYLLVVVRSRAINYLKDQQKNNELLDKYELETNSLEENIWEVPQHKIEDLKDLTLTLNKAIELLPKQQREVIRTIILENKTTEEIARQLNLSMRTVQNSKHIAIKKLKQYLKEN